MVSENVKCPIILGFFDCIMYGSFEKNAMLDTGEKIAKKDCTARWDDPCAGCPFPTMGCRPPVS